MGYTELAKEFRKRDNNFQIGVCVGEVTSLAPVTIKIHCLGYPLEFTEFYSAKGLVNDDMDVVTGDLYVEKYPVKIGDKLICIMGNDNQGLYVLEKMENIADLNVHLK